MEILNLLTNEINQNGYHFNKLTLDKIGILYIAPVNLIPEDCLACDGYVLKIVDYKKLFSAIGTKFNTGSENSDEFRIPDYNITGRFLQPGTNVGNQINAGLPDITGNVGGWQMGGGNNCNGAFAMTYSNRGGYGGSSGAEYFQGANFYASRCSSIYGSSSTVQPPSQIVHLCIKYK